MKVWVQDWRDGHSLHLSLTDLEIFKSVRYHLFRDETFGRPYNVELKEPVDISGSGHYVERLPSHEIHVEVFQEVKPSDGSETLPLGKYLAADLKNIAGRVFTFRVVSPDLGDKRRIGVLRDWTAQES